MASPPASNSSSPSWTAEEPRLIPELPDDVSLHILTRLPLSSHVILSQVSRAWRSLLLSPSFFSARSLLGHTEPILCLSLRTSHSTDSHWYLLHIQSDTTPHHFTPLPSPPLPTSGSSSSSLGPLVFLLGGSLNNLPSPSVQILDACTRSWSLGPHMSVSRHFPASALSSRRLYALGGCHPSSDPWIESLDPDLPHLGWSPLPSPPSPRDRWMHGCAVVEGNILAVADRGGVVFDTRSKTWGRVPPTLDFGWKGRAAVVRGLICSYDYLGKIKAYDPVEDRWMEVKGLGRRLPRFLAGATMADVGGRLCVVWEGRGRRSLTEVEICFAGIEIVKWGADGLRGEVVWSGSEVLPLPRTSTIAHCLSVCF